MNQPFIFICGSPLRKAGKFLFNIHSARFPQIEIITALKSILQGQSREWFHIRKTKGNKTRKKSKKYLKNMLPNTKIWCIILENRKKSRVVRLQRVH